MGTKEWVTAILFGVFTILVLPPVWERIMSAAPDWVWRGMILVCVVLAVMLGLMSDPVSARLLASRQNPVLSTVIIGSATTIISVAAWLIFVIFQPEAKLTFFATATTADYPPNTTLAGISWRTRFSELRVLISNPTMRDYEHLDLFLTPDHLVAAIGQITNIPNVNFELKGRPSFRMERHRTDGTRQAIPLALLANEDGYRICCPNIPAKDRIEIIMATVTGLGESDEPIKNPFDVSYRIKIRLNNKAYWYGHTTAPDEIYGPKKPATKLSIKGTYVIAQQVQAVTEDIKVKDIFGDAAQKIREKHR